MCWIVQTSFHSSFLNSYFQISRNQHNFQCFFQTINATEFRFQKDPTDKFMNLFEKSVFKKSFKHVINTEMALIGCNFFIIQIDSIILFNIESFWNRNLGKPHRSPSNESERSRSIRFQIETRVINIGLNQIQS